MKNSKIKLITFLCFGIGSLALLFYGVAILISHSLKVDRSDVIPEGEPELKIGFVKLHRCGGAPIEKVLIKRSETNNKTEVIRMNRKPLHSPTLYGTLNTLTTRLVWKEARYKEEIGEREKKSGAKLITVLRDPVTLSHSLFDIYRSSGVSNESRMSEALKNADFRQFLVDRSYSPVFGINQMSWELGLNWHADMAMEEIIKFLLRIESQFDLVLIYERLYDSLVLMSEAFRWPLTDFVILNLDKRPLHESLDIFTYKQENFLREINFIDAVLYEHFMTRFDLEIKKRGEERIAKKVAWLQEWVRDVEKYCHHPTFKPGKRNRDLNMTHALCSKFNIEID